MNYYEQIKEELINNQIYKKVKDYSKNRSDLNTYYKVGKLLVEAGKSHGESILKIYSNKLVKEIGKQYTERTLRRIRQFYGLFKEVNWSTMSTNLSWSHYCELLSINDMNEINYYIEIAINQNLSVRDLRNKIKNKDYERLDNKTKEKLINKEENKVNDFIKNPIFIKNSYKYEEISEKILKQLILENIEDFMKELGNGFSFIGSEYKIKIGSRYNYIDLLLFNIKYNCYVVVEVKVTELKKEHIGQIKLYMNYVDKNIRSINQEKTIGLIICKKDNKFIMEYCSDSRIYQTIYTLK